MISSCILSCRSRNFFFTYIWYPSAAVPDRKIEECEKAKRKEEGFFFA